MTSPSEEERRLAGLIQENTTTPQASEEELRLVAIRESLQNPSEPGVELGTQPNAPPGSVTEDFVQLTLPGYSGDSLATGSQGSELVSPMLSMGSATSGVSRGGGFSRNSGSKFAAVLVVRDKSVCFSDIGDGGKFCLKVGCCVVSHKGGKKFDPTEDGSIVIARSQDVAFATPSLGGTVLPASVWKEWQELPKTLEEWNPLFDASQGGPDFASAAEHEARLRDQHLAESYKTPAKKKGESSSYAIAGSETLVGYSPLPDHSSRRLKVIQGSSAGPLTDLVLSMDSGLKNLSLSFFQHVKETREAVSGLERADSMLEAHKVSTLGTLGLIGVMGNSPFQTPTVFGTLGSLARKVQELSTATPAAVDFSPIEAKLESFKRDTKKVQNLGIDLTVALSNKVKTLEAWRQGGVFPVPVSAPPPAAPPPIGVAPAPAAQSTSMQSGNLDAELRAILSRLDFLELENADQRLEIQRLVAEGDETAVKFGGLGLKSLEETKAWIDINSPGVDLDFSLFPDVYFVWELIDEEAEMTQAIMLQTMNRLKNLNLDSEYQAKVLSSFQLEVPRFLHGSTGSSAYAGGAGQSQLSKLPTVKSWNQGPESKKQQLERKLPHIRKAFRTIIVNALMASYPVLYVVATLALERSISWSTSFASFLDRSYENAHVVSRMPEAKAWGLSTQLTRRIFAEMFVVRMGTVQSLTGDRKSLCASILWAVFRTHDKMNEFDTLNFEDHPAIASEYIKFLATNSGFDSLGSLEKDLASLKSESKETARQTAAAMKKADAAVSNADFNKKGIAELGKRVDKKVDK